MNRATSVYLDVIRFTAALIVFLGHVSGMHLTGGLFWQFGPYMTSAVVVFFVLSGFVISYVTQRNESAASIYAINRAARVYSVALPALIVTFALDTVGRTIAPGAYNITWGYVATGRLGQFASSAFFTGELWNRDIVPGSCLLYWSLDYEIWYYVMFGLALFAPRRWSPLLLAAICIVAGPKIVLAAPLWLLGVGCQRLAAERIPGPASGAILCFGSVALLLAYELFIRNTYLPRLYRPDLINAYVVGVLFAAHLIGFSSFAPTCRIRLGWLVPPIRWFAGATFTLYLFHAPIAHFLAAISPWPIPSWRNRLLVFGGTFLLVMAVAQVTERKKDAWRRAITALVRPLLGQQA
ncbi:MAG TPA: acyltransferase [Acetobacteraceae bacterium]|nr:acyltransferase [Acetobacteraceae bacterium]